MKRYKNYSKLAIVVLVLFSFTACNVPFNIRKDVSQDVIVENTKTFKEFCDEEFIDTIKRDTFSLNFIIKNNCNYGIDDYDICIGTYDDEKDIEDEGLKDVLKRLKCFDYSLLSDEDKITYKLLENYLEVQIKYEDMKDFYNLFSPSGGIISNIPINYVEYNIDDKKDVEDYIALVKEFKPYMQKAFDYTRKQSKEGYFMADFTADKTIEQCKKFLEDKEENPIIINFNKKIESADFLTEDEKNNYIQENKEAVQEYVISSYQEAIDLLEELKGTGTNNEGLCKYKGGKEYYENRVKDLTGTSDSMKELIKDIDSELNSVVNRSYSLINNNPNLVSEIKNISTDSKPEAIIKKLKDSIDDKYPEIGDVDFNVEYQDKALEIEGLVAYYMSSRIDDFNNNSIKINGSETYEDLGLLYTTLAHESFPGHLYQHVYCCEAKLEPIRFLVEPLGYTEGWAEYVSGDTLRYLGLSEECVEYSTLYEYSNQLITSRIDIGVNYEGWTREDLLKYLKDYGVEDENYAELIYESVVSDPGISLPYGVGHFEMLKIRRYAEEELKDKFNEKEFNQVILETGPVQFELLKDEVSKYIKNKNI